MILMAVWAGSFMLINKTSFGIESNTIQNKYHENSKTLQEIAEYITGGVHEEKIN